MITMPSDPACNSSVVGRRWLFTGSELGDEGCGLGAASHVEFGEDARDVVLDGLFGEEEAFTDLAVGQAVADEVEDLSLLLGEDGEGVLRRAFPQPLEHLRGAAGVEKGLTGRDRTDGAD